MNFGKAFTYVFDDPRWFEKIIIPILFSLIPVVGGLVLMGYVMRTNRNVAEGVEFPLPVCDFGVDLGLGFKLMVVNLVYAIIPMLLGLLLILGLFRNLTLLVTGLTFLSLSFGQMLLKQHDTVLSILLYLFLTTVLLYLGEHDRWILRLPGKCCCKDAA